jgi:hypothetical protein
MLSWLYNFFVGQFCGHKYKLLYTTKVVDENDDQIGTRFNLQCEKCGRIKIKKSGWCY